MADTAYSDGLGTLYHWQRFDEARLSALLQTARLYCSSPKAFNDPWDCKPHFNSEVLENPAENAKHVAWAVDVCRRKTRMSEEDIDRMRTSLGTDKAKATQLLTEISEAIGPEIDRRYRVYCLSPDVGNLLMWSHYAQDHKGIALEFSVANDVICGALRCQYLDVFPMMKLYDDSIEAHLQILLAKSSVWFYEREYRLIAQERSAAIKGAATLMTDDSMLQLPKDALTAVVAGCQCDFDAVRAVVHRQAPAVAVKRAIRIPNRYAVSIKA